MVNSLVPQQRTLASPVGTNNYLFNRFDQLFREESGWPGWQNSPTWPRMDVCETTDAYLLELDLPGVQPDNVQIEIAGDVLAIFGERPQPAVEEKSFHRVERDYGQFQRRIRFPSAVAQDQIQARFQDGVLRVTVPKAENAKARKIPVKT